jgi:hypothetical protein
MKEGGPKFIREKSETKEEMSKRYGAWKTTGKGTYFKTTKRDLKRNGAPSGRRGRT